VLFQATLPITRRCWFEARSDIEIVLLVPSKMSAIFLYERHPKMPFVTWS